MESTLSRCLLRLRPTTTSTLLPSQPSSVFRLGTRTCWARPLPRPHTLAYSTSSPAEPENPESSNRSNESRTSSTTTTTTTPKGNEVDNVLNKLEFSRPRTGTNTSTSTSSQSSERKYRPFVDRKGRIHDTLVSQGVQKDVGGLRRTPRVELKLNTKLGRQVVVEPERGFDLNTALRVMSTNLARNRVRGQKTAQKFHVRRGQVIKNQRSERWRRLFKFSFTKTVEKVYRMKAQGW